jgi:hypothetical protein
VNQVGTLAHVKQGDYGTALVVNLRYRDNDSDITDAVELSTDVVFIMTPEGSATPTINREAATVTAVTPATNTVTVSYTWQSGDTATVGRYYGEFEFDLSGGPATAPTNGYVTIDILNDLG